MKTITVLLCDDHCVTREALRLLLEGAEDIDVVGEVKNGPPAVVETKRLLPDVVLLDLSMSQLSGVETARQIAREAPSSKVLIVSTHSDDQHVQHAMEAGAAGYLMKETVASDLLPAIREVAEGNAFFSPPAAKRLLQQWQVMFCNGSSAKTKVEELTIRQAEILQLVAEGYANKQIGALLSISIKTVEKHRQGLMNRLNIHDIASLTRYAVSVGAVNPEGARDGSISSLPRASRMVSEVRERCDSRRPQHPYRCHPSLPTNHVTTIRTTARIGFRRNIRIPSKSERSAISEA